MKVSFSSENDFNATYDLPGYGCTVEVEVKNGIVTLDVHDEVMDDIDVYDEAMYTNDEYCNGVPCYEPINGEYEDNFQDVEEEEYILDDIEEDEETVDEEVDETPIESTEEYQFVKAIQKIDTDGSILALLDSLTNNKSVRETTKKASETFNKVVKELSNILSTMK